MAATVLAIESLVFISDRSADDRQRVATRVRADRDRVNAINTTGLSHATRTSIEVVRSAYATALDGLALPYGDTTVGSWWRPHLVV